MKFENNGSFLNTPRTYIYTYTYVSIHARCGCRAASVRHLYLVLIALMYKQVHTYITIIQFIHAGIYLNTYTYIHMCVMVICLAHTYSPFSYSVHYYYLCLILARAI